MAYLLRVELPDVPGSLGALATALGGAGADIEAIEIVEHRADGKAVDDVLLEIPPSVMADALITACQELDGVRVHWISRYAAGANLSMDLEAVETFTAEPHAAFARLVDVVPSTFRVDWALAVRAAASGPQLVHRSPAAPELVEDVAGWLDVETATTVPGVAAWDATLLAAAPTQLRDGTRVVLAVGRRGGPEFLSSELARLGHMVALAGTVQTDSPLRSPAR